MDWNRTETPYLKADDSVAKYYRIFWQIKSEYADTPEDNEDLQYYRDYVYADLREGNICVEFIENQNQNQAKGR